VYYQVFEGFSMASLGHCLVPVSTPRIGLASSTTLLSFSVSRFAPMFEITKDGSSCGHDAPNWQQLPSGELTFITPGDPITANTSPVRWKIVAGAPRPAPDSPADSLGPNQYLAPGDKLVTTNGYEIIEQTDGNLVEYHEPGNVLQWDGQTEHHPGSIAEMQSTGGNLVIIAPDGVPVVSTGTNGHPGSILKIQTDANVVVIAPGNVPVWNRFAHPGGLFPAPGPAVPYYGSMGGTHLAAPIVSIAATNDGKGYWELGRDGGIFSFGDAKFFGSTGNLHLNAPVVRMAVTADGKGYWLVAADGGVFSFGDAKFYGSTGNLHLTKPVVGMARTSDGRGYWLVAADGGVFSFGDAKFYGGAFGSNLTSPIVDMVSTQTGKGYWLVAADGAIYTYGDAAFFGPSSAQHLLAPIVGIARFVNKSGYWLVAADGGIFTYGRF
jgi:TM2 domain-containing membrane protein YozV